ncbi:MAG: biotin transporter BioY [Lachnospiraceae bacterium]|nr:biotin transporter BioY [Lachnospiraceae bacterium]
MGKTYDMVYIALFAVLIAICAWISIPTVIPFTMQTFAIFLTVGVLGGRKGTAAILIYILLGLAGIPVFSGFRGGIGVLFGNTGGYIWGFLFAALMMWGMERLGGKKPWVLALSMLFGMVVYNAFGTGWFLILYAKNSGSIGLMAVLGWCVFPFLIPDIIKISLAWVLSKRLRKSLQWESGRQQIKSIDRKRMEKNG